MIKPEQRRLMMTQIEVEFYQTMMAEARAIAKQLAAMNKLKALELKSRADLRLSPEMVDSALED